MDDYYSCVWCGNRYESRHSSASMRRLHCSRRCEVEEDRQREEKARRARAEEQRRQEAEAARRASLTQEERDREDEIAARKRKEAEDRKRRERVEREKQERWEREDREAREFARHQQTDKILRFVFFLAVVVAAPIIIYFYATRSLP
jgi:hypothetical protein